MTTITEIPEFLKLLKESNGNIDDFVDIMLELQQRNSVSEADRGEQISKGKNPIERSNDQKYDVAAAATTAAVPGEVPGANVAIGNKDIKDADEIDQKPTKIEMKDKPDTVETKPTTKMNKGEFANIDAAR